MDKYVIAVNGSQSYVTHGKHVLGALKSALNVIQSTEPDSLKNSVLEIRVTRVAAPKLFGGIDETV